MFLPVNLYTNGQRAAVHHRHIGFVDLCWVTVAPYVLSQPFILIPKILSEDDGLFPAGSVLLESFLSIQRNLEF